MVGDNDRYLHMQPKVISFVQYASCLSVSVYAYVNARGLRRNERPLITGKLRSLWTYWNEKFSLGVIKKNPKQTNQSKMKYIAELKF